MTKKIVLTGGGSAGHVAVNLALIPVLQADGWEISYIGSKKGIENDLIADFPDVSFYAISTGKLRRAMDFSSIRENIKDSGRFLKGIGQARRLLKDLRPDVIFSKGGFVSVPVVIAGWQLGIPVIAHESDVTPGLANRMSFPFIREIMLTFEKTANYVPAKKAHYLGPILRDSIRNGSREEGLIRYGLDGKKPILLILGGSLGAASLNRAVWNNLDALLERFDIVHGVGAGKGDSSLVRPGYIQLDYIKAGMADALAMSDLILSRAGSNAIFEFLYYHKPMILVPYIVGSRGDQVINAEQFRKAGYAEVWNDQTMTETQLMELIDQVMRNPKKYTEASRGFVFRNGLQEILQTLELARKRKARRA
ncbi:undecaprenyldiphospho-muramoylpentapeptide beta-N-acetylglucosaminyltransferase [Peptoniphilaceae bacterium SGI.137]|nr:undecaprenyldiphospho-muramoylpentapeptide beta-N-acetylglucosaminyltransferase [Peptoniphilaceae bacterium]MDD7543624.1 undecaprenyldiphospho-muramoylpentapeptide beta-N-acetylglucosaminyltransferase [Peptoniphilaceae bacterium]MDY4196660.1 undecaprenyldiphospho-muramoylpentapeptide beta-N-acetylglucosaminyltransferase [Peptoniphilaceae bacterium]MDY5765537.1 undecaprenyldiphospho-muramoylpentapeptide beta-N-acetylglucosaminyltransferase [Peptoniphilaceae bacterium]MDY5841515.1 undecaprenyl